MFIADYTEGKGWHDKRIVPYAPLTLDPSAMIFHYGQTVFEGLKAYLGKDDSIRLFRPEKNMERLNHSNDRLSMPSEIGRASCRERVVMLVSGRLEGRGEVSR